MASKVTKQEFERLLKILKARFDSNMQRHEGLEWPVVEERLIKNAAAIASLIQMEESGGEPDVVQFNKEAKDYFFCDCAPESPLGRRSYCYDREALLLRKNNAPTNTAVDMATSMGVSLLNEEQYTQLQSMGKFDLKTSSWLLTPTDIKINGGAIFGECRYGRIFVFHNGAESYFSSRGLRCILAL